MKTKQKRILVTGANGFVGSNLVRSLCKNPNNIVVAVRRDLDVNMKTPESFTAYGDITDYDFIRRVVADYEINSVFHLASQSIVRICANDPISAYKTNVLGAVNLLEALRHAAPYLESVVISTSDKAFGHAPLPYNSDTPLMPKYTYEATKACQDIVGQNYFYNYDLPVKIARFSNVFGPGDPNWSRLIPNTINRIVHGESPILYSDVANYVREFIYIDDAVSAFETIDVKGMPGDIYCVGGGLVYKAKDLIQVILGLCDSNLSIEIVEKAATFKEVQEQWLDTSKIKSLGWAPKYDLETGLNKTIAYYRKVFAHDSK